MPTGIYIRSKETKIKLGNFLKRVNKGSSWWKDKKGWTKKYKNVGFQKGHKINNGRIFTEQHKINLSKSLIGKKLSKKTKTKIKLAHRGKKLTKEHKIKIKKSLESIKYKLASYGMLGKHHSKKSKKKIGEKQFGNKNHNWQGGKSFEPYGLEFNENLREVIRNRDKRKCQLCKIIELYNLIKLTVHHIDYNKLNNNPKNLISLCKKCHQKTNYNRSYWVKYFNEKRNV